MLCTYTWQDDENWPKQFHNCELQADDHHEHLCHCGNVRRIVQTKEANDG